MRPRLRFLGALTMSTNAARKLATKLLRWSDDRIDMVTTCVCVWPPSIAPL